MADATPDTATPDISGLTSEQLSKYIAMLHLGQGLPNVQPDQTPVDTSGFWGGLRHGISLLGEAAGSPGPETLKALSPKEREQAGLQSLSRFGTGLLAASHYVPGQTFGSNLAQGFQAAERGYDTTARQAMGMLAARQGYAVESQHADLEKLKAALPLLSLQQQLTGSANTQKLLSGQVTPGTNIGTGGSIAPFVAKNLPEGVTPEEDQIVRTVIGEAAGQPLTGQQAVAHVIRNRMNAGGQGAQDVIFAANQFEPWNNPKTRAGLEAIDPNSKQYQDILTGVVRPVMGGQAKDPTSGATNFYSPTAQATLAKTDNRALVPSWAVGQKPTAVIGAHEFYKLPYGRGGAASPPAPGQAGAPSTPTPVGQNPNAKVQIPPATTPAAPGQATMPPPEPPLLAGGAQTAGPGASTSGVIPTLPPAAAARSAADVTDIEAGMANAQANPLVHQPGAIVTAQAGGQPALPPPPPIKAGDGFIVHPGTSYQEFFKREAVPPPTTEDFNPNLSQAQQKEFAVLQQGIQQRIANRPNLPIAQQQTEATKIIEDRAALEARIQATIQAKAQAAATNVTKWNEKQEETVRPRYEQMIKSYDAAAQSNLAHAQATELARINADFDKDKEGARIAMRGDEKRMQDHATAAAAMQPVSDQLRQLPALMQNLPPGGSLSSLMGQYPQVASLLEKANIVSPGTADNVSIFMGLTNHLAGQLRVTGSGSMSDKDLASFKTVMPQLLQSPEGRQKAVAFLQNIADRVVEAQEFTDSYFKRIDPKTGKPAHDLVHLKDAINAPRRLDENGINQGGLGPVVPAAPKFEGPGAAAAATEWLRVHTQSGRPYTAWLPDENGVLRQQLMVRE